MQALKPLQSCRHGFCRQYGLVTTDEHHSELCIGVLDESGTVIDVNKVELIYRLAMRLEETWGLKNEVS